MALVGCDVDKMMCFSVFLKRVTASLIRVRKIENR